VVTVLLLRWVVGRVRVYVEDREDARIAAAWRAGAGAARTGGQHERIERGTRERARAA
jgi:hypothetical protein